MKLSTSRLRIVVLGYLVRGPLGGLAWHHLQYVLGLARLGHDVYFFEDSDDYASCYDPVRDVMDRDPAYGLGFTGRACTDLGLATRWAYFDLHRNRWHGPAAERALDVCRTADVLLNLSAVNPVRSWLQHVPVRVLIDTDPVFTQIRHLTDPSARALAATHTAFFSYGENIGQAGCTIPTDGLPWQPTRQPIVMNAWRPSPGPAKGPFSTVMLWDSYRPAEFAGVHYGMKGESFEPFVDLPRQSHERFELALGSRREPRERLERHGWTILDPRAPTKDLWTYQDFIRQSKAEFSVAKHGYVITQSGWFSERSAAYLASGRPVVIQDTGFSRWLDADGGVMPFRNAHEARAAIQRLDASYEQQCLAARALAEKYFDSDAVLTHLLEQGTTRVSPRFKEAIHEQRA
jgi:hypothetical protein